MILRPTMARVAAGWFWMGSEGHYAWESPRHRVFVNDFEIGITTVTRRLYEPFLRETGRAEPRDWRRPEFQNTMQPVVGVNWFDAVEYCRWLSEALNDTFRLPTEAEWEKACRGGRDNEEYSWGDAPIDSLDYFQGDWPGPRPAGGWEPNGFGLFGMGGNVHEWCADWYSPGYYAVSPQSNPLGPDSGARRVSRGGSWRHAVKASRNAHRSSLPPDYRYTDYGFRVVRDLNR